jgi:hypothetical protein
MGGVAGVSASHGAAPVAAAKGSAAPGGSHVYNKSGVDLSAVKTNGPVPDWTPGSDATATLNQFLTNGGSPQLAAQREVNRRAAASMAVDLAKAKGLDPIKDAGQIVALAQEIEAASDSQILMELHAVQSQGLSNESQTEVYFGTANLADVRLTDNAVLPTPEQVFAPGFDPTAALNGILQNGEGSAELAKVRQEAAAAGNGAANDRDILLTLISTHTAAANDPSYASGLGIVPNESAVDDANGDSNSIPPEYRGSVLMMLAWVFTKMDQTLHKKFVDSVNEYTDANDKNTGKDEKLSNSLNAQQMKIKANMEAWSNNASMGSSIISQVAETLKSVWR